MAINQVTHPRRLAGNVYVVRAMCHAGGDQLAAIERKWPGRAEHHASVSGQRVKRGLVIGVGNNNSGVACAFAAYDTQRFQSGVVTSRQRPAQATRMLGKVGDGLSANESRCTEEHDVILAIAAVAIIDRCQYSSICHGPLTELLHTSHSEAFSCTCELPREPRIQIVVGRIVMLDPEAVTARHSAAVASLSICKQLFHEHAERIVTIPGKWSPSHIATRSIQTQCFRLTGASLKPH
jgi:hypothetical protein